MNLTPENMNTRVNMHEGKCMHTCVYTYTEYVFLYTEKNIYVDPRTSRTITSNVVPVV